MRIRDFELPKTSPLPIIIPFSPNYRDRPGRDFWRRKDDKEAPIHVWKARMREWTDFLADHFVSPDDLYHGGKGRLGWILPLMRKMVTDVRKACPGLPIATTLHDNSYGSTSGLDYDWFIRTSQDYEQFCGARIGDARARGRKAWWYLCDGPYPPFANMYLQSAAIEGRLLMGAMTHRMRRLGALRTGWKTAFDDPLRELP